MHEQPCTKYGGIQRQVDLDSSNLWGHHCPEVVGLVQVVDILIYKGREELEVSSNVQTAQSLKSGEATSPALC
jgi:hypothetical protein